MMSNEKATTTSDVAYVVIGEQPPPTPSHSLMKKCVLLGCAAFAVVAIFGAVCPPHHGVAPTYFMRGSMEHVAVLDCKEGDIDCNQHDGFRHEHHAKHHHHPLAPPDGPPGGPWGGPGGAWNEPVGRWGGPGMQAPPHGPKGHPCHGKHNPWGPPADPPDGHWGAPGMHDAMTHPEGPYTRSRESPHHVFHSFMDLFRSGNAVSASIELANEDSASSDKASSSSDESSSSSDESSSTSEDSASGDMESTPHGKDSITGEQGVATSAEVGAAEFAIEEAILEDPTVVVDVVRLDEPGN